MPVSKAQQKATHKYIKANYDRMELVLPKGSKQALKDIAEYRTGGSVNELVKQALSMYCPEWISKAQESE